MFTKRAVITLISATMLVATPMMAQAGDFDWNGTWSGKGGNGRTTVIKIAKGKVTSWASNGQSQKIGTSSVGKSTVSITHAEGAKVTLSPKRDGTVTYTWRGTNASSSAVLRKS